MRFNRAPRSRDSKTGKQNQNDVDNLHCGAQGDTWHLESIHDFSGCVDVGREDCDHQDCDAERSGATEAGHKESAGARNFKDAGEHHQKCPRGKRSWDDAGRGAGAEEVKQDARDQQRERDDHPQKELSDFEVCVASSADGEEGQDGEDKQKDGDGLVHACPR